MDKSNILICLSNYLPNDTPEQISTNLLLFMANLMFKANGPITLLGEEYLETLPLHRKCYDNGAIRLWTFNLYKNDPDNSIPEKAKTFYQRQPRRMKQECINSLREQKLDMYTIGHLFGDYYKVNVYINTTYIQEAAGERMTKQHKYSVKMRHNNGKFKLIIHRPHRKRRNSFISKTNIITSKYALRQIDEKMGSNVQIGLFIPLNEGVSVYDISKNYSSMYLIYPPDRLQEITLDVKTDFKLYLFTNNEVLITFFIPGQSDNMYFTIPENTQRLLLIESKTEKEARKKINA